MRWTSVHDLLILMCNQFPHLSTDLWGPLLQLGQARRDNHFRSSTKNAQHLLYLVSQYWGAKTCPNGATFYKMIVSHMSIFQIFKTVFDSHASTGAAARGEIAGHWYATTCIQFGWYPLVMENHPSSSICRSIIYKVFSNLSSLWHTVPQTELLKMAMYSHV